MTLDEFLEYAKTHNYFVCTRENVDQMYSEIEDAKEFWMEYKNSPLVRDIISSVRQYIKKE